jgi:hypothetical protein
MEILLWFPGEDFVRYFREGSKVLIVRRGGNVAGRFLEAAVYVLGGRRVLTHNTLLTRLYHIRVLVSVLIRLPVVHNS